MVSLFCSIPFFEFPPPLCSLSRICVSGLVRSHEVNLRGCDGPLPFFHLSWEYQLSEVFSPPHRPLVGRRKLSSFFPSFFCPSGHPFFAICGFLPSERGIRHTNPENLDALAHHPVFGVPPPPKFLPPCDCPGLFIRASCPARCWIRLSTESCFSPAFCSFFPRPSVSYPSLFFPSEAGPGTPGGSNCGVSLLWATRLSLLIFDQVDNRRVGVWRSGSLTSYIRAKVWLPVDVFVS